MIFWRWLQIHFLDINKRRVMYWPVTVYATSHYPNQLWPSLITHICHTRTQWDEGYVSKTWSLCIFKIKTDIPVKCREFALLFIHGLLCPLVHSHSTTYFNYWNMCRLDYSIMLITLLAPTRYQTISKHHAASNVTIFTYIEEIGKYWGNWEIPRKMSK